MDSFDFEQWYDIFIDEVYALKYSGPIDKDSFNDDFENGKDPRQAAQEFVKEMEA